jgi:hypothetical protein
LSCLAQPMSCSDKKLLCSEIDIMVRNSNS